MTTNQQIYSEYGIQPTDSNLIAEKFGLPSGDHSDEAVARIRSVHSEAKRSGTTLKKYLLSIQVEVSAQPQAPNPRTDRVPHVQAPTDPNAVGDLQLAVQGVATNIVQGSFQTLNDFHEGLQDHEEAFATAIVARANQSGPRSARLVIEGFQRDQPAFFRLAPTGAAEAFAEQASRILALDSGAPQHGYAALKQATVVEEDDQRIEQSIG